MPKEPQWCGIARQQLVHATEFAFGLKTRLSPALGCAEWSKPAFMRCVSFVVSIAHPMLA
eukprot:1149349-Pelagomonas_calceolata.AAC.8